MYAVHIIKNWTTGKHSDKVETPLWAQIGTNQPQEVKWECAYVFVILTELKNVSIKNAKKVNNHHVRVSRRIFNLM